MTASARLKYGTVTLTDQVVPSDRRAADLLVKIKAQTGLEPLAQRSTERKAAA